MPDPTLRLAKPSSVTVRGKFVPAPEKKSPQPEHIISPQHDLPYPPRPQPAEDYEPEMKEPDPSTHESFSVQAKGEYEPAPEKRSPTPENLEPPTPEKMTSPEEAPAPTQRDTVDVEAKAEPVEPKRSPTPDVLTRTPTPQPQPKVTPRMGQRMGQPKPAPKSAPVAALSPGPAAAPLSPSGYFNLVGNSPSRVAYYVPHGDEQTAKQVLQEQVGREGGVGLVSSGRDRATRGVNLNGIFKQPSDLRKEAEDFLFDQNHDLVVALHNTFGDARSLETTRSDDYRLNDPQYGGYILTTDPKIYSALQGTPYNVFLQATTTPQNDDGSLSRRAAALGRKYINVEALRGDVAKQRAMLQAAMRAYNIIYGVGRDVPMALGRR